MIDLLLTVLCSTTIALILKHNDTQNGQPIVLLAGNYLVASVISLILFMTSTSTVSLETFLFGAVLGLLFVFSFFAFTQAVASAGTALATISSRLSVVIPVLLSILVFNELPGRWQLLGFAAAGITLLFFYRSLLNIEHKNLQLRDYLYLLWVFVGIGINDFSMKIFNQMRPPNEKPFFLLMIFSFAFIYSMLFIILRKIKINRRVFVLGNLLGLPNMFSSWFLLGALSALPAIIVYPAVNIGIIVLTAVLAAIIWKERLDLDGKLALLFGVLAIVLININ